jgi:hypothetical protein
VTDHPIIFSAPMILALLDGRKIQTRRIIKNVRQDNNIVFRKATKTKMGITTHVTDAPENPKLLPIRASVGDRLWVREAWRIGAWAAECYARGDDERSSSVAIDYLADVFARKEWLQGDDCDMMLRLMNQSREDAIADGRFEPDKHFQYRWSPGQSPCRARPSIFMPRWASRLTLTVTDVRVQRLQDISEADAWAEGCKRGEPTDNGGWFPSTEPGPRGSEIGWDCARDWFADLWDSINGPEAWDANPWVAVYSFTVAQGNIDQMETTK